MSIISNLLQVILPPLILLSGGYLEYLRRLKNRQKRLRSALFSEIRSSGPQLDQAHENVVEEGTGVFRSDRMDLIVPKGMPINDFLPTTVYDSNVSKLGLLDQDEIEAIVDYYCEIHILKDAIKAQREYSVNDTRMNEPQNITHVIGTQIIKSLKRRKDALESLQIDRDVEAISPEEVSGIDNEK